MSVKMILLVEDDVALREIVAEMIILNIPEVKIIHANNGMEGLMTLNSLEMVDQLPDLILTDIKMPVMCGIEMIEAIKRDVNLYNIPIIIQSASIEKANIYNLVFLEKPIQETMLIPAIQSHLYAPTFQVEVC